jgi:hypothetical protein
VAKVSERVENNDQSENEKSNFIIMSSTSKGAIRQVSLEQYVYLSENQTILNGQLMRRENLSCLRKKSEN